MPRQIRTNILRLFLWIAVAASMLPLLWLALTSLKPAEITQALPPVWNFSPTLSNYRDVLSGNTYTSQVFGILLLHTIFVTIASTLLGLLAAIPAAYALARLRFVGKRFTANWILSTIMFPPMVSVIPVFILASRLGLIDTWPVLVVPYAAFNLPMMIWMLRSSIKQIPIEIEHAAMMDGASQLAIIRRVILPLLTPGIISTCLIAGMFAWNEFLFALTLTRSAVKTAPVGISEFTNMYGTQWGTLSAAAMVTVAPILVIALLMRRRMVEGLTFGAVK